MTPDSNLQCNTTQRWQKAKWHTPGTQTTVQSGFPSQNSLAKFKQSVTFPPPFLPPPHLCCLLFLFKCSQVHGHAFLLCDEGGQVQREAVCVIQQPCRVTWKHRHRDEVFVWSNNEKKLYCVHILGIWVQFQVAFHVTHSSFFRNTDGNRHLKQGLQSWFKISKSNSLCSFK